MAARLGRALIDSFRRRQQPACLAVAGAILALATAAPLALLVGELARGEALARSAAVLRSLRTWLLLGRSVALAAAVTAAALLLGAPLGFLFARADLPGRRVALLLHGLPLFVPPFILALGWFHLLGGLRRGLLFGPVGVVVVLALAFTPVVTALVALALRGIDPALEEAARLYARPWRVATRIQLPLCGPAVALGALLVFALTLSELGVPLFLRVDAYPAAVFARLGGVDYAPGEASALCLPLLLVALGLLALERRWAGRRALATLGTWDRTSLAVPLGRWRVAATAACWSAAALAVAPLFGLAARAGVSGLAAARGWLGSSVLSGLLVCSLAATGIVALATVLGHALARRLPGAGPLDALAVLGFVTPAAVLGVGLVGLWNRPATRLVYGSVAILVIGLLARYAVVGIRAFAVAVAQSPSHLEESAAAFGAGFLRRLTRIVLPLHRRALAAAWLLAAVFCLRDLETVVLFYPPGWEPLTVRIFTLEANGPEAVIAALSLVHVAVTALLVVVGAALLSRNRSA